MAEKEGRLNPKELIVLGLLAAGFLYGFVAHEAGLWPFTPSQQLARLASSAQSETGLPAANAARIVAQLHKSHIIVRERDADIWLDPAIWLRLDAPHKEQVAIALYTNYRARGGESLALNIYDGQTGRLVARYGRSSGFRAF